jgi:ribosomal protein S18 acetylase RimI-like enzyme
MAIIRADRPHCPSIARLHLAGISAGFLPRLGIRFLTQLYSAMVVSKYGVLLVSVDEKGDPDGFVSGSILLKSLYLDFLFSTYGFRSAIEVGSSLFKREKKNRRHDQDSIRLLLTKCIGTLLYPFKRTADSLPKAELISIVVDEKRRSGGIAKDLLAALEREFFRQGISQFKVYAGAENKRACSFYEKLGGKFMKQIEVHKGEISNLYVFNTAEVGAGALKHKNPNGIVIVNRISNAG